MVDVSQIRPLRWLGRLVLGIVSLYLLTQVIGRVMRRLRPGLTPLRAIPSLNIPLRWKFFGTPERILDRAGISPSMQVLEIGPGPGFMTVPLAQRVSALEGGSVTCVEIQPEMIALLRERLQTSASPGPYETWRSRPTCWMQALSDGHGGPIPHASVSQHENTDLLTGVSSKGVLSQEIFS